MRAEKHASAWPKECDNYMDETGCDWTEEYACPGAETHDNQAVANDDGSIGFKCCCP